MGCLRGKDDSWPPFEWPPFVPAGSKKVAATRRRQASPLMALLGLKKFLI
jgi:hypothetical protein